MSLNKKFYDDYVWGLKYRPTNLDDLVMPDTIKNRFRKMLDKRETPNLLFSGVAGVGKTSMACVLADTLDSDVMYINGSIETSIDVLRGKISQFVTTVSFKEGKKIVILDECLEENESVMMGTLDSPKHVKLKDLDNNTKYPIISYNTDTHELEDDVCEIISEKEDEVFELELEDGRKIKATKEHPFFIERDGELIEIPLGELQEGDETLTINGEHRMTRMVSKKSLGTKKVRNLCVEKNHTFITSNGIVTHNCDRMSLNTQEATKSFLEEYTKNARFIFITNNLHKIIEPLKSRLQLVEFNYTPQELTEMKKQFAKIVLKVLTNEKVDFNKKIVGHIINDNFPDMRKTLNELQKHQDSLNDPSILDKQKNSLEGYFEALRGKDFTTLQKHCANTSDAQRFFTKVYDNIKKYIDNSDISAMIVLTSEYSYKAAFVKDQRILLMSYSCELMNNIKLKG